MEDEHIRQISSIPELEKLVLDDVDVDAESLCLLVRNPKFKFLEMRNCKVQGDMEKVVAALSPRIEVKY